MHEAMVNGKPIKLIKILLWRIELHGVPGR